MSPTLGGVPESESAAECDGCDVNRLARRYLELGEEEALPGEGLWRLRESGMLREGPPRESATRKLCGSLCTGSGRLVRLGKGPSRPRPRCSRCFGVKRATCQRARCGNGAWVVARPALSQVATSGVEVSYLVAGVHRLQCGGRAGAVEWAGS